MKKKTNKDACYWIRLKKAIKYFHLLMLAEQLQSVVKNKGKK